MQKSSRTTVRLGIPGFLHHLTTILGAVVVLVLCTNVGLGTASAPPTDYSADCDDTLIDLIGLTPLAAILSTTGVNCTNTTVSDSSASEDCFVRHTVTIDCPESCLAPSSLSNPSSCGSWTLSTPVCVAAAGHGIDLTWEYVSADIGAEETMRAPQCDESDGDVDPIQDGFLVSGRSWCNNTECNEHASCEVQDSIAACACVADTGYTGDGYNCTCTESLGFTLVGDTCVACAGNCATCTGTAANCTACVVGFEGPGCADDIDECVTLGEPCSEHTCLNSYGSFTCEVCRTDDPDSCPTGMTCYNGAYCTDIDECALGLCGDEYTEPCTNTIGSYMCVAQTVDTVPTSVPVYTVAFPSNEEEGSPMEASHQFTVLANGSYLVVHSCQMWLRTVAEIVIDSQSASLNCGFCRNGAWLALPTSPGSEVVVTVNRVYVWEARRSVDYAARFHVPIHLVFPPSADEYAAVIAALQRGADHRAHSNYLSPPHSVYNGAEGTAAAVTPSSSAGRFRTDDLALEYQYRTSTSTLATTAAATTHGLGAVFGHVDGGESHVTTRGTVEGADVRHNPRGYNVDSNPYCNDPVVPWCDDDYDCSGGFYCDSSIRECQPLAQSKAVSSDLVLTPRATVFVSLLAGPSVAVAAFLLVAAVTRCRGIPHVYVAGMLTISLAVAYILGVHFSTAWVPSHEEPELYTLSNGTERVECVTEYDFKCGDYACHTGEGACYTQCNSDAACQKWATCQDGVCAMDTDLHVVKGYRRVYTGGQLFGYFCLFFSVLGVVGGIVVVLADSEGRWLRRGLFYVATLGLVVVFVMGPLAAFGLAGNPKVPLRKVELGKHPCDNHGDCFPYLCLPKRLSEHRSMIEAIADDGEEKVCAISCSTRDLCADGYTCEKSSRTLPGRERIRKCVPESTYIPWEPVRRSEKVSTIVGVSIGLFVFFGLNVYLAAFECCDCLNLAWMTGAAAAAPVFAILVVTIPAVTHVRSSTARGDKELDGFAFTTETWELQNYSVVAPMTPCAMGNARSCRGFICTPPRNETGSPFEWFCRTSCKGASYCVPGTQCMKVEDEASRCVDRNVYREYEQWQKEEGDRSSDGSDGDGGSGSSGSPYYGVPYISPYLYGEEVVFERSWTPDHRGREGALVGFAVFTAVAVVLSGFIEGFALYPALVAGLVTGLVIMFPPSYTMSATAPTTSVTCDYIRDDACGPYACDVFISRALETPGYFVKELYMEYKCKGACEDQGDCQETAQCTRKGIAKGRVDFPPDVEIDEEDEGLYGVCAERPSAPLSVVKYGVSPSRAVSYVFLMMLPVCGVLFGIRKFCYIPKRIGFEWLAWLKTTPATFVYVAVAVAVGGVMLSAPFVWTTRRVDYKFIGVGPTCDTVKHSACAPYYCDMATHACFESCSRDSAKCMPGYVCNGNKCVADGGSADTTLAWLTVTAVAASIALLAVYTNRRFPAWVSWGEHDTEANVDLEVVSPVAPPFEDDTSGDDVSTGSTEASEDSSSGTDTDTGVGNSQRSTQPSWAQLPGSVGSSSRAPGNSSTSSSSSSLSESGSGDWAAPPSSATSRSGGSGWAPPPAYTSETDSHDDYDIDKTKRCPGCLTETLHQRGHGSHEIQCVNCGLAWCYACSGMWPCSGRYHGKFCDARCDCPLCRNCEPGTPCSECNGCPICGLI